MRYETLTIPCINYLKFILKAKTMTEYSRVLAKMTGSTAFPHSQAVTRPH